jgi:hypothetical protein
MAYVSVNVDIDEFDTEEIFDATLLRIKLLKKSNHKDAKNEIKEFLKKLGLISYDILPNNTKVDDWKDELWPQIKAKYSLEELEKMI